MANDIRHALEVHVNDLRKFGCSNFPERRIAVDEPGVVHTKSAHRGISNAFGPRGDLSVVGHVHHHKSCGEPNVLQLSDFFFPNVRSRERYGRAG